MKINILRKRREFVDVSKNGSKLFFKDLIVQYKGNDNLGLRIGYTASKKVGGAVHRNRAKRRMRAAAFLYIKNNMSCLERNVDIVFIAKMSATDSNWNSFFGQFVSVFGKIFKNT